MHTRLHETKCFKSFLNFQKVTWATLDPSRSAPVSYWMSHSRKYVRGPISTLFRGHRTPDLVRMSSEKDIYKNCCDGSNEDFLSFTFVKRVKNSVNSKVR